MATNNNSAGNIGFLGLLAIVFITLKLTGFIAWSWWWVLLPLWGGLAVLAIVAVVGIIMYTVHERARQKDLNAKLDELRKRLRK